jgi:hypothetical protein
VKRMRSKLTYANVMSTLAVFIALGGSSYAALTITGKNVKNSSLTYRDLKRNTLGGSRIKESRLGTVRRARNADLVGGLSAGQLLLKCPAGTLPTVGTCVEVAARPPGSYGTATGECRGTGFPRTPGRRLPTHQELLGLVSYEQVALSPGGELTANIYPAPDPSDPLDVLILTSEAGAVGITPNTFAGSKRFRCAVDPLN